MTTWAQLLSDIRVDLKDTTADKPRFSDAALYLYAKDAIRDYTQYFPLRIYRLPLTASEGSFPLPDDLINIIGVESPRDRFLEKRMTRPGVRYANTGLPTCYYIEGGELNLNSSPLDGDKVLLTYDARHIIPQAADDIDAELTVPELDEELIRLYVKAKAAEMLRTQQAALDRFKPGNGQRDDNPILPEAAALMQEYRTKIAERMKGGTILLYRTGEAEVIHQVILDYLQAELQEALIDTVPTDDTARAGVVSQGILQGDPDPDQARISVTLHENDPDVIHGTTGTSGFTGSWNDNLEYVECGGSATWNRRFTVVARCLLVNSQEDKATAQQVARTVRNRIEKTLLNLDFEEVHTEDEYVSRGVANGDLAADMVQAGGPPDAYDYFVKVRFQVQTTTGVK